MSVVPGFPMPQSIEIDNASATPTYGRFTAAPLQSGFGHTLGNALRRVLLSSIEGAAISAVRIENAPHEFASLPNVIEDVTEIVLNLKRIRLTCDGDTPRLLQIKKDKKGPVTAADIISDGSVEILNKDQVICNLDKDTAFNAEIEIINGRGYRPGELNKCEDHPINTIVVDSLFSPISRVSYHVGAARVGEETEMDSLQLEIWTDGRIEPEEALQTSAKILQSHLRPFLGKEAMEESSIDIFSDDEKELYKKLIQEVETLELSVRSMNCLNNANIKLIGELCTKTESRMLKYKNFGKKSLDEIVEKLAGLDLSLGMNLSDNLNKAIDDKADKLKENESEDKEES